MQGSLETDKDPPVLCFRRLHWPSALILPLLSNVARYTMIQRARKQSVTAKTYSKSLPHGIFKSVNCVKCICYRIWHTRGTTWINAISIPVMIFMFSETAPTLISTRLFLEPYPSPSISEKFNLSLLTGGFLPAYKLAQTLRKFVRTFCFLLTDLLPELHCFLKHYDFFLNFLMWEKNPTALIYVLITLSSNMKTAILHKAHCKDICNWGDI